MKKQNGKEYMLRVRMTLTEQTFLEADAKSAGKTVSEYVRERLFPTRYLPGDIVVIQINDDDKYGRVRIPAVIHCWVEEHKVYICHAVISNGHFVDPDVTIWHVAEDEILGRVGLAEIENVPGEDNDQL